DAETGAPRWSARPGTPYPPIVPIVAVDDRWVIAVRDVRLFAYNRAVGLLEWTYELPSIPSSPPVSDGDRLYVAVSGNQLMAFDLPARAGQEVVVRDDYLVD